MLSTLAGGKLVAALEVRNIASRITDHMSEDFILTWFLSLNVGRLQCRVNLRFVTCGYQGATWRCPS